MKKLYFVFLISTVLLHTFQESVWANNSDCIPTKTITEIAVNRVRAKLLVAGDLWWDGDNAGFVVPKRVAAAEEVAALFAGGIWMGGLDPAGNLKIAAKTYGTANGVSDYFPGPLQPGLGVTDATTCNQWNRFFKVSKSAIQTHVQFYLQAQQGQMIYTADEVPEEVLGWPAKGNPYFQNIHGFELPNTGQGLADFYDENGDGLYNPLDGDFPKLDLNCESPVIPDEMVFWIFNDAGNVHQETMGAAMQMEFQTTAFAFDVKGSLDYSTFYKYKVINRAIENLEETYFGLWVDPDLGCYTDDYFGCDSTRSLSFVYNQDAVDGFTGCTCIGDVNSYCFQIPIIGIDFFKTPAIEAPRINPETGQPVLDSITGQPILDWKQIGMSSFTYYVNPSVGLPPQAIIDPYLDFEFYNHLKGRWRNGQSMTWGGLGLDPGSPVTTYAFSSPPDCVDQTGCWSMCNTSFPTFDMRFIQSTGPFQMKAGQVEEIVFGNVFVPEESYPCPNLEALWEVDDQVQALFDNCFELNQEGPDAPELGFSALDQELFIWLWNDSSSNNMHESFTSIDPVAPLFVPESQREYKFEGYKVFQLADEDVSLEDLDDPDLARLVFQSDLENGVGYIFNWEALDFTDPNSGPYIWTATEKVMSTNADQGLKKSFRFNQDAFATGSNRLENGKTYYFATVAYAYNNWKTFVPSAYGGLGSGQRFSYLEGTAKRFSAKPGGRFWSPDSLFNLNAVPIVRLDGVGAGGNFLDISEKSRQQILEGDFDGTIEYKGGAGPFKIEVLDPAKLMNRTFELTLIDEDLSDNVLEAPKKWKLTNLDNPSEVVASDRDIASFNQQVLLQYGFSIGIEDGLEPGNNFRRGGDPANGKIGYVAEYENRSLPEWLDGIPNSLYTPFDYIHTELGDSDYDLDPGGALSTIGPGIFTPYYLLDYRYRSQQRMVISPVWSDQGSIVRQQMKLEDLNNIDLVFTSDKSKWSRCVVVESTTPLIEEWGLFPQGNRKMFDLRAHPSVGKEDGDGDGLPDPDGDGEGMGWFPGYAIDVETGQRLNIFFGEASFYRCDDPFLNDFLNACDEGFFDDGGPKGADMMWNPGSQRKIEPVPGGAMGLWQYYAGGMHFIYVTKTPYDSCKNFRNLLRPGQSPVLKSRALREITWAGFPTLRKSQALKSYAEGLIPNDLTVKIRVDNSFKVLKGTGANNGYPTYIFSFKDLVTSVNKPNPNPEQSLSFQAYPNPFSPSGGPVMIEGIDSEVWAEVWDLYGKPVRVGLLPDQNGRVIWNGKSQNGLAVLPGVYLIRLRDKNSQWPVGLIKVIVMN